MTPLTQTDPKDRKPLDGSLFSVLRCIIAVAHADGKIHDNEMDHIGRLLYSIGRTYNMSPQQMGTFERDLAKSPNIEIALSGVTDPAHRCLVLNFANILTRIDGELHPKESEFIKKLQAAIPDTPENKAIRGEIQRSVTMEMASYASDAQNMERKQGGMATYVLRALLKRVDVHLQD
ncbi:MAG: hypothetical protein ACAH80_06900 [Alphaproteobacteria bacterium]